MGEVIELEVDSTVDIPPEKVLNKALNEEMEAVIVVGWTEDGSFYFDCSHTDIGGLLLLLEMGKRETLSRVELDD